MKYTPKIQLEYLEGIMYHLVRFRFSHLNTRDLVEIGLYRKTTHVYEDIKNNVGLPFTKRFSRYRFNKKDIFQFLEDVDNKKTYSHEKYALVINLPKSIFYGINTLTQEERLLFNKLVAINTVENYAKILNLLINDESFRRKSFSWE